MELSDLEVILHGIQGCAYATICSTTKPIPGLRKVTTGTRVILFFNTEESLYEQMVKRRLLEAGKNPDNFVLSDLPWGEKVPDTPIIMHRGNAYLQTIVLEPGLSVGYAGNREVDLADFLPPRRTNQGLPKEDEVIISTYRLDHIDSIKIVGEVLIAELPKALAKIG